MGAPRRPGERRALSHVGGPATLQGDVDLAAVLASALEVPTSADNEELARAHVHGFHSYPARMHPLTAKRLVDALSRPGQRVLDPFCGSGTVLVEAAIAGREAIGVDANPLAVRLAQLKVKRTTEGDRARLLEAANKVADVATARRKAKSGPSHRYGKDDVAMFHGHVLLELDGLRLGLDELPGESRSALELVFSSILTKLSKRGSDTSERGLERRIAAGYPARLFVRKTEELIKNQETIAPLLAASPRALVLEGDARRLEGIETASIDATISSPPYPGTYDYLAHHAARLRWLRLHDGAFDRAEVGARRHLEPLGAQGGAARFGEEIKAALVAMRRVVRPTGTITLLIADSVVAGRSLYATDLLAAVAPGAGLRIRAVASQPRPHFHGPSASAFGRRARHEHAIVLEHDRRAIRRSR